jgi:rubrerythrin
MISLTMFKLTTLFRHAFGSEAVLYECRNCGTTLNEETEHCPACGAADVATYQLTP